MQLAREQRAGAVLVDDGVDTLQTVIRLHDGDPSPANGDDDIARRDKLFDQLKLDDALRQRRGHDAAIAPSRILDKDIALLRRDRLCLFLCNKAADGLGRIEEAGIVRIDNDLGDHGGAALFDPLFAQRTANRLLQVIADIALGHRAALGKGHGRRAAAFVCRKLHCQVDHADLGAVAVADDDLIALLDKVGDHAGRILYQFKLLLRGAAERVAAKGNHDSLCHGGISAAWRRGRP